MIDVPSSLFCFLHLFFFSGGGAPFSQSLSIISANAVIDGEVKFAPGTIFLQPPNTKSQTLLGCLKSGIPLEDFVLGGERRGASAGAGGRKDSLAKRERDIKKDGLYSDERQVGRRTNGAVYAGGGGDEGSVKSRDTFKTNDSRSSVAVM